MSEFENQENPWEPENKEPEEQPNIQSDFENGNSEKPKKPKKTWLWILGIAVGVIVLGLSGFGLYKLVRSGKDEAKPEREVILTPGEDNKNPSGEASSSIGSSEGTLVPEDAKVTVLDVSDVVDATMPCVVAIVDSLEVSTYNPYSYFFGGGGSSTEETTASGSGVIIAKENGLLYIATNAHVVNNASSSQTQVVTSLGFTITFSDGTTAKASIKGTDVSEDLAIVTVKLSDLSEDTLQTIRVASLGNSDSLKVGAGVIVIGNAVGYGQSVTTGIVSAKDREVTIDDITRKLIQTDAAINPGNSGGGMFDRNGRLVGINCAKTVSTNVEGMGFAIPISRAVPILQDLMNMEELTESEKGYLGINGETVPENYIDNFDYPAGVSVTRIIENSPAEKAGLHIYDIISAVNGTNVSTMNELTAAVTRYRAGTTVKLTVYRPSGRSFEKIELNATLAEKSSLTSDNQTEQGPKEKSDSDSVWKWLFGQ